MGDLFQGIYQPNKIRITQLKSVKKGVPPCSSAQYKCELTGDYPVFTVVMVIYRYIHRIGELLLPPIFV